MRSAPLKERGAAPPSLKALLTAYQKEPSGGSRGSLDQRSAHGALRPITVTVASSGTWDCMKFVYALLFVTVVAAGVAAAQPDSPASHSTAAKIRELEGELAAARADYQLLLASCGSDHRTPTQADASQTSQMPSLAFDLQQQEQQAALDDASWYITSVEFGTTEINRVFVRYGWKLTIKNGLSRTQVFDLVVQFLDQNDLVVDSARVYAESIGAQDVRTLYGDKLISMPGATRVVKVHAVAKRLSR